MATTDIYTTTQRVRMLSACKKQIDQAIKLSKQAESVFKDLQSQTLFVDFGPYWALINENLSAAASLADSASDRLASMAASGFTFRYRWEVGKAGVTRITFNVAGDPDLITPVNFTYDESNPVGDGTSTIISAGDLVVVEGTADNDGNYAVVSGSSQASIAITDGLLTGENCETVGASVTVYAHTA